MKTGYFFRRFSRWAILSRSAAAFIAMGWSGLAFAGPIYDAVESGNTEEVKALLKDNPDLVFSKQVGAGSGWTPLCIAASRNRIEIAEILLANKADVNAKTDDGYTPLHAAAQHGYVEMVQLLLNHKADVNATDVYGSSPLHKTAWCCSKRDVADLLLANKADVNAKAVNGTTPLHVAAWMGHKEIVESLIAHNADVNARGEHGTTPLHLTAEHGDIMDPSTAGLSERFVSDFKSLVEVLLANGADVNATNNNGNTPLHLAAAKGFKNMEALLRQHGGHE